MSSMHSAGILHTFCDSAMLCCLSDSASNTQEVMTMFIDTARRSSAQPILYALGCDPSLRTGFTGSVDISSMGCVPTGST
jgi:hypothetical protein